MKYNNPISVHLLPIGAMLLIIAGSCNSKNKQALNQTSADSTKVQAFTGDSTKRTVITQKYSNSVTKAEIAVKGNKRDGITRNYHEDGTLMSEINYVNNEKDGLSRDFYPKGKVRMEVMYKHGIMQGEAKWHYETGEVYRLTPYVNGKAEGIQKEFYKDGKLKAELPHKSGNSMPGLKEYNLKGELVSQPSIVITELDKIAMEGKFVLKMHLSNHSRNVKWYEGDLKDWSLFPKALTQINDDNAGDGTLIFPVNRGSVVMKTITIYAVATTEMGNELVLKKSHDLAYKGL